MSEAAIQIPPSSKPTDLDEAVRKKRFRRLIITIVLVSIGIHLAAGLVAGVIIVARYFVAPPAVFVAQKDVRLPAQEREHKMNMASFDGLAPKPSFTDKLQSSRPSAFSLPELPKIPLDQMLPLDPSAIISDQVTSLTGVGGRGNGNGNGLGGGGGNGSGISFFGVQTTAKRILLLYDISKTVNSAVVRAGVPMTKIRDETARLINGLSPNTRFGMAEFAQNFAFFNPELIPATEGNRAAAQEWLGEYFALEGSMPQGVPGVVTGSPGFLILLDAAFKMQPDVIMIISDGSFQRNGLNNIETDEIEKELQRLQLTLPQPAKIHFIGVGMKPDIEKGLRRAIARYGGGGKVTDLRR